MKHLFWVVPIAAIAMFVGGKEAFSQTGSSFWMNICVAGGVLLALYILFLPFYLRQRRP